MLQHGNACSAREQGRQAGTIKLRDRPPFARVRPGVRLRRHHSIIEREMREDVASGANVLPCHVGRRVGMFGILMGIALLLTGIGFLVLTLGGALERKPAAAPQAAPKVASATN